MKSTAANPSVLFRILCVVAPVCIWTTLMGHSQAQSTERLSARCSAAEVEHGPQKLPHLLGKPTFFRSNEMIVDFNLDAVAPNAPIQSRGGVTTDDRALASAVGNCSDSPTGDSAELKSKATDDTTRLTIEVVGIKPLGRSSRGWPGVHCTYRVADTADPLLFAELTDATIPPLNELNGLIRVNNVVYATVQYNGYAKEIGGKGNLIVAFDLCSQKPLWKSDYLTSNAGMLLYGDYLVTGYGFTSEKRFLYVLNRWSGHLVQKINLPKSPEELRISDNRLFVRLYDGYATFPIENTKKQ